MPSNKVLILSNPLNHEGGVVNYYNLFFKHFKSNTIALQHAAIGSRTYLFYYPLIKRLLYPFYFVVDVLLFCGRLIFDRNIKIVQVSPSLIPVPLLRDGVLVVLAKLFGKKVVVFYRGWKLPTYNRISHNTCLKRVFNTVFQTNTLQVVLASSFKNDLLKLKPKHLNEILITTTAIDKEEIIQKKNPSHISTVKVLFLGRLQDLKGLSELIQAICTLKQLNKLDNFCFTIVGHEYKLGYIEEMKNKLASFQVEEQKVNFTGRKTGEEKFRVYSESDIYILPSYTEGCPNSVLEALCTGLFCITTNVGALNDIINKDNGIFVSVKDANSIVSALLHCSENRDIIKSPELIAKKHTKMFDIREIVNFFESKYTSLLNK